MRENWVAFNVSVHGMICFNADIYDTYDIEKSKAYRASDAELFTSSYLLARESDARMFETKLVMQKLSQVIELSVFANTDGGSPLRCSTKKAIPDAKYVAVDIYNNLLDRHFKPCSKTMDQVVHEYSGWQINNMRQAETSTYNSIRFVPKNCLVMAKPWKNEYERFCVRGTKPSKPFSFKSSNLTKQKLPIQ
jgi:hypothetical protein